ncbi:MAG: NUDIX hydrolase [bacterium]
MTPAPVRDAATVLVLRPGPAGNEIFMVRRGSTAAFMARAMVFPGGVVDADDADDALLAAIDLAPALAAERLGLPDPARAIAFYVAAIRETFEEVGVLLARRDGAPVDAEALAAERAALNEKRLRFKDFVAQNGLRLQAADLHLHAWWVTPPIEKRRYDTRFFVAALPPGQVPAHDARETTAGQWLTPAAALAGYTAGELQLALPTLRTLNELCACATLDDVRALQAGLPPASSPRPPRSTASCTCCCRATPPTSPPAPAATASCCGPAAGLMTAGWMTAPRLDRRPAVGDAHRSPPT